MPSRTLFTVIAKSSIQRVARLRDHKNLTSIIERIMALPFHLTRIMTLRPICWTVSTACYVVQGTWPWSILLRFTRIINGLAPSKTWISYNTIKTEIDYRRAIATMVHQKRPTIVWTSSCNPQKTRWKPEISESVMIKAPNSSNNLPIAKHMLICRCQVQATTSHHSWVVNIDLWPFQMSRIMCQLSRKWINRESRFYCLSKETRANTTSKMQIWIRQIPKIRTRQPASMAFTRTTTPSLNLIPRRTSEPHEMKKSKELASLECLVGGSMDLASTGYQTILTKKRMHHITQLRCQFGINLRSRPSCRYGLQILSIQSQNDPLANSVELPVNWTKQTRMLSKIREWLIRKHMTSSRMAALLRRFQTSICKITTKPANKVVVWIVMLRVRKIKL